jgi:hypothetical protein
MSFRRPTRLITKGIGMPQNEMTRELSARFESIVDGFDELLSGQIKGGALTKTAILRNWCHAQSLLVTLAGATDIPVSQIFPEFPVLDAVDVDVDSIG